MVTKNAMDNWKFFYTVLLPTLISFTQNAASGVRVVLTADPPWSRVSAEETVHLTCEVKDSEPSVRWEYSWKKLRGTEGTTLSSSPGEGSSAYTLSHVREDDSAQYWCEAKAGNHSAVSATRAVIVHALVVLTMEPGGRRTFYTTEQVTLSCGIRSNRTGWRYLWYKDGQELPLDKATDTYTIQSVVQSDSGTYICRGKNKIKPMYTASSNSVILMVSGPQLSGVLTRPQAVLTLETAWIEIFRSDSLTLRCQVEGSSAEWNYTWYRDGRHLPLDPSGDRLTLTAGNDSYSSEYKCRGNRTGQPSYTEFSEGFRAHNIVSCTVENLARVAVGAAILLFLSVIVNEGFWRRARKMRRCCI
ncbi:neural cell adhesion molecule 1-like isoform X1 [Anguilla rostrata]|uniref:neural cell adhesion molecule 1-like isoform X1 n=1 Tax=Anguilla rostrata TaxID=7938 RepID=UPI0030D42D10